MARRCDLTGKGVLVGYNVSHANNKTKKKSQPNLRNMRIKLEDGTKITLKVAISTLRTLKKPKAQKSKKAKDSNNANNVE